MDNRQFGLNYLYFGLFFTVLILTCTSSILLKDNLTGSRWFFWFYAFGQVALEVSLFAFLCGVIYRFIGRLAFWLFVGATFFLFIVHFLDFLMDRVLDLSVWNAFKVFVLDESLENFFYLLDASGVPLWMWGCMFTLLALLPVLGMIFYKGTSWAAQKKLLFIPNEVFLQLFVCIPAALFFWDYSASKVIDPDAYTEFVKSLPWKRTFLMPKTVQVPMENTLRPPKDEKSVRLALEKVEPLEVKPNIYLFVAESLREDVLTEEAAPNLSKFRQECIRANLSLSNANATQISWFSIFHSEFPMYWKKLQSNGWKMGSPALAMFKKLGYKIRVYSSAELHYYDMGELLFGHMADSLKLFPHSPPKEAHESDKAALDAVKKDLESDELKQGQFIIVFLDGTHFDYSWPKQRKAKFAPFATEFAYFRTFQSEKNIELIRNRYLNAVHYLDSLFGDFVEKLPRDAFVAFTGDHGEEFFDHGHLFHCSHLVGAQTKVPIYVKIPGKQKTVPLMSQMDIMPTLLDGVAGIQSSLLEGESALRERVWPYVATARFNASRSPYEFCLQNSTNKVIFQFNNRKNIFESTDLQIISVRDSNDQKIAEQKDAIQEWIYAEFGPALDRLFIK